MILLKILKLLLIQVFKSINLRRNFIIFIQHLGHVSNYFQIAHSCGPLNKLQNQGKVKPNRIKGRK